MNKIMYFFDKWGFVMALGILCLAMLFALGCCIYTAIINPFVGIVGSIGTVVTITALVILIRIDIAEQKDDYYDSAN